MVLDNAAASALLSWLDRKEGANMLVLKTGVDVFTWGIWVLVSNARTRAVFRTRTSWQLGRREAGAAMPIA